MNHIELFAGCGGLSLGLETAGFELLMANELSPMASETFAHNLLNANLKNQINIDKVLWVSSNYPRSKISTRLRENPNQAVGLKTKQFSDLLNKKISKEEIKRSLLVGSIVDINTLLESKKNGLLEALTSGLNDEGLDLVSGGPPCQSFSLAGLRDHKNQRNQMPWEFAKFVSKVKPKIALLENVSGILRAFKIDNKPYYAWFEVAKAFAKIGYTPLCLHINAKHVGAAQNRPRFIMLAFRKDIYSGIKKRSKDQKLLSSLKPSEDLLKRISKGEDPDYGSLKYFDIQKDAELFTDSIFSPLLTNTDHSLISVKSAIDDLRKSGLRKSQYVTTINNVFNNIYNHPINKQMNNEFRQNNHKVKARFRLYQIMSKLEKSASAEITKYLKSEGSTGLSKKTLELLQACWLLDLDGKIIQKPTKPKLLTILSNLYTKKQTQRALIADSPAPAALSIPDDACHYHDSIESQRTLTVREMARIQSFPDWFEIKSKVTTGGQMRKFEVPQYTQIGNAVPPILGLALGKVCNALIKI